MDDDRITQLDAWMAKDPTIRPIVSASLKHYDEDTLTLLRSNDPAAFGELYDTIATMIEDIPIEHTQADW